LGLQQFALKIGQWSIINLHFSLTERICLDTKNFKGYAKLFFIKWLDLKILSKTIPAVFKASMHYDF